MLSGLGGAHLGQLQFSDPVLVLLLLSAHVAHHILLLQHTELHYKGKDRNKLFPMIILDLFF